MRHDCFRALCLCMALLLSACGMGDRAQLMAATKTYGEAWASHDVARIVALHTADSTFTLHVEGQPPAQGREQIAAQFRDILSSAPDYAAEPYQVNFGSDFVVIQYRIKSTPNRPMRLGKRLYTPDGSSYQIAAIDYIRFRDGLVQQKDTYIDLEAVTLHSREVVALSNQAK